MSLANCGGGIAYFAVPRVGDTLPIEGRTTGELFYKSDTQELYSWDGSTWSLVAGGGAGVIVSADAGNIITAGGDGGAYLDAAAAGPTIEPNITVSAPDTFTLAQAPTDPSSVRVFVNGVEHFANSGDFTVTSTTVTWNPGSAGYNVLPGDVVNVIYY